MIHFDSSGYFALEKNYTDNRTDVLKNRKILSTTNLTVMYWCHKDLFCNRISYTLILKAMSFYLLQKRMVSQNFGTIILSLFFNTNEELKMIFSIVEILECLK